MATAWVILFHYGRRVHFAKAVGDILLAWDKWEGSVWGEGGIIFLHFWSLVGVYVNQFWGLIVISQMVVDLDRHPIMENKKTKEHLESHAKKKKKVSKHPSTWPSFRPRSGWSPTSRPRSFRRKAFPPDNNKHRVNAARPLPRKLNELHERLDGLPPGMFSPGFCHWGRRRPSADVHYRRRKRFSRREERI